MGKYAESLPLFDEVLKIGEDDEEYWLAMTNKARVLTNMGRPHEAISLLDKVLATDKMDWGDDINNIGEVWNEKGRALMKTKQFKEALECFEQAIESDEFSNDGYYGKARALAAMGKIKEAIACLDKIKNIKTARLLRGKLLKRQELGR